MKKTVFVLPLVLLLMLPLKAQENQRPPFVEKSPSVGLAFSLIPFIYNTAEIDLDIKLKDHHWLTVAPRLQYGNGGDHEDYYFYSTYDYIKNGVGLGLNYRYFPMTRSSRPTNDGFGPFVSAGLRGLTTLYAYKGNRYVSYTDDFGNTGYYVINDQPFEDRVSQLSFDLCLGYSMRMFDILYAEAYLGLGTRFSNYTYDPIKGLDLGDKPWDTGYNGYTLAGGIRIGIYLDKYTR